MSKLTYDPELLRMDFLGAASLRRVYAKKYRDHRKGECIRAAELLEKLASTVEAVDTALLDIYGTLFEFGGYARSERHQEMLREVGFHRWPQTATEFVKDFLDTEKPTSLLTVTDSDGLTFVVDLADLQPMGSA